MEYRKVIEDMLEEAFNLANLDRTDTNISTEIEMPVHKAPVSPSCDSTPPILTAAAKQRPSTPVDTCPPPLLPEQKKIDSESDLHPNYPPPISPDKRKYSNPQTNGYIFSFQQQESHPPPRKKPVTVWPMYQKLEFTDYKDKADEESKILDELLLNNTSQNYFHFEPTVLVIEYFQDPSCVALAPNKSFFAAGFEEGYFSLWPLVYSPNDEVHNGIQIRDGMINIDGGKKNAIIPQNYSKLKMKEKQKYLFLESSEKKIYKVTGLAFNILKNTMLACSEDGSVQNWCLKTGKCLGIYTLPTYKITQVCIHPSYGYFATAEVVSASLWSYDYEIPKKVFYFKEKKSKTHESVKQVIFHPTELHYLATSTEHHILLWSFQHKKPVQVYSSNEAGITSIAFSPDGKTLAAGDSKNCITICHWKTLKAIYKFEVGIESIRDMCYFKEEGKYILAVITNNNTLQLWHTDNIKEYKLCDRRYPGSSMHPHCDKNGDFVLVIMNIQQSDPFTLVSECNLE